MKIILTLLNLCSAIFLYANVGVIEGVIYEEDKKTPVAFASIAIEGTNKGATSDIDGLFRIEGLTRQAYNLLVSCIGYEGCTHKITPSLNSPKKIEIILKPMAEALPEIVISSKSKEALNYTSSIHTLDARAIRQSAGSANDVMQTIQSLAGIAAPVGLSNELMVRGGASVENSYYVEGIELPLINHFSSQGTSNGIRSILNNTLLRKVKVHTSAFPITTGNTLSGVFDFSLKNGNTEKLKTNLLLSTSDASITLDGPLNDRTTFALVFRQSYLKPTLKILDRPLLATYNDWQYKLHWNMGANSTLSLIGVGNTDKRAINKEATDTPLNQYIVASIRDGKQWHLTNALKYQYFRGLNHTTVTFSVSDVFFKLVKEQEGDLINTSLPKIDYISRESHTQLSIKNVTNWDNFKWTVGGQLIDNRFESSSFFQWAAIEKESATDIDYKEWNAFSEISQQVNNRFNWSLGIRVEGNDFASSRNNLLDQLSPRLSIAYELGEQFSATMHTGLYYQLPANITLAYRTPDHFLANQAVADYFSARHLNLGLNWTSKKRNTLMTMEGFHKKYSKYPFSVKDKVVLANKGDGFTRIGEEAITSTGTGRTYGIEFNIQQNLFKGFYGHLNYTLAKSEFMDDETLFYVPSSMDARHIINMTLAKQLKNDWQIGIKGRMQSGLPYTPFDIDNYATITKWNPLISGIKDYTRLNTMRISNSFGLDLRIDKAFAFQNSQLKIYTDLIDILRSKVNGASFISVLKDKEGNPQINKENPNQYQTVELDNELSSFMPTLGIEMTF